MGIGFQMDQILWDMACVQKGPYGKIWKFARDAYFQTAIHLESFLKISMIYH